MSEMVEIGIVILTIMAPFITMLVSELWDSNTSQWFSPFLQHHLYSKVKF